MIAEPVRRCLESHGARYHTVPHVPRFSAQETAQAAHVSGKHFAKAVLLKRSSNGIPRYLLAVLPAHEKVNMERLSHLLGDTVSLASEGEAMQLFPGIELGALPALGELAGIPVVADACLPKAHWIVFHGGALTDLVEMRWADYARVASPLILNYGRLPPEPDPLAPS
jgi:Ala-tRNA(Pro) deacylase